MTECRASRVGFRRLHLTARHVAKGLLESVLNHSCSVTGLLDTITSTADSKDCPGVCVHTLATLICYEVLEDVVCPSPSMRCCVEPPPSNSSLPPPRVEAQTTATAVVSSTGHPTRRPQVRMPIYLLKGPATSSGYIAGVATARLAQFAHDAGILKVFLKKEDSN